MSNDGEAILPHWPVEDYKEPLSVTGEGGWFKKKKKQVGEKSQRLREAEADGRAMQRRSIVPADLAETFHGCSRGDVTGNQEWRWGKLSRRNISPQTGWPKM